MSTNETNSTLDSARFAFRISRRLTVVLMALTMACPLLLARPAAAVGSCTATANQVLKACRSDASEEYWLAIGNCINLSDADERQECTGDAREDRNDAREECTDQHGARLELCEDLGEERYDPDFDPDDFTTDFMNLNPYFPLAAGNMWVYEAEDEEITVEVLDETKLIEGVTCIVVNDVVAEDGEPIEDTDDWYGQDANGDVYYCGEISLNYEVFDGDDPEVPELVDVEGSWKAGREDAKPGVLMFAAPEVGTVYRQEMSLGEAEDAAEVLANDYSYGDDPELDEFVPQELAEALCNGDCVVTKEFTPVEPDAEERKYYAPGIGLFLEVDVESGDITQLVECNLPACEALPGD